MVKRRTLGEGLTPEEEAFMDSGTTASKPAPEEKVTPAEPAPEKKIEKPAESTPSSGQQASLMFTLPTPVSGSVGLTTRIPADISMALMAASMQRQLQNRTPYTRQDIVAEALADWLKKNGSL